SPYLTKGSRAASDSRLFRLSPVHGAPPPRRTSARSSRICCIELGKQQALGLGQSEHRKARRRSRLGGGRSGALGRGAVGFARITRGAAQALESRVPKLPAIGELAVFDLDAEHGRDPADPARLAADRRIAKRRQLLLQLLEPGPQLRERVLAKAGADLAAIDQSPVLVAADQQRAEVAPRSVRGGETTDHEAQPPGTLDPDPGAASAPLV